MEPALAKRDKLRATKTAEEPARVESAKREVGGIEELALKKAMENPSITIATLVSEISSELSYPKDRVVERIIGLSKIGRIKVVERTPYKPILDYALSPYSLWFWSAALATMFSLGLIQVTSGPALYLRYVFGALLILFLPGYSLIEFLYSKKADLDSLTRLALSIGLSIAIVPLVGLVLNYTPLGIRLYPIEISLVVITLLLLVLALRKKHTYYKISKDVI